MKGLAKLVKIVEIVVRIEHSRALNRPIYLVGESFWGCLALAVAARNPDIDLMLIFANPATSFGKSFLQLETLLTLSAFIPEQISSNLPYVLTLLLGTPVKMVTSAIGKRLPSDQLIKELSQDTIAMSSYLSVLSNAFTAETLRWKLEMLKSAAAFANSQLHAVKAQTLILASGQDQLLPSTEEAERLSKVLPNCQIQIFEDKGHALFLEEGVSFLSILIGASFYRHGRRHDYVKDYFPPTLSEFQRVYKPHEFFEAAMSPVVLSTLGDGSIERSLAGIPSEGPVLYNPKYKTLKLKYQISCGEAEYLDFGVNNFGHLRSLNISIDHSAILDGEVFQRYLVQNLSLPHSLKKFITLSRTMLIWEDIFISAIYRSNICEMASYAAVLSLFHTLNNIKNHPRPPISLDQSQVDSLTQNLTFFQDFLERYPSQEDYDFESRIAAAAYAAEDVIESHIFDQIHDLSKISILDLCECLRRVMGSIKNETTFARNIYGNPLIVHHFDLFAWVTISQEYSRGNILQVLCQEAMGSINGFSEMSEDEMGLKLYQHLWGRRYLIVMDDIWSVEAWGKVKSFFPDNNGSRIMITTRLSNLAFELSDRYVFKMQFLEDNKSWDLLCEIELIDRNLMLISELQWDGEAKLCKMHDLLRDVCLREAQKQKLFCIVKQQKHHTPQGIDIERRICINPENENTAYSPQFLQAVESASHIRSVLYNMSVGDASPSLRFRLLRLYLEGVTYGNATYSNNAIFKQVNLRYLSVKFDFLYTPRLLSLCSHFWNLQTLDVQDGHWFSFELIIPSAIWEIPSLRHVKLFNFVLPDPPNGEHHFVLKNLQTLKCVINFKFSEEVVKRIPNIRKLSLEFKKEHSLPDFCLNNLGRLQKLESLTLEKKIHRSLVTFPQSLKKLILVCTRLGWEDLTRCIGSLPLLQFLALRFACVGLKWETAEGNFCSLRVLIIWCYDLRYWETDSVHFPRLEHLRLHVLEKLEEIPSCIGDIPTLKSILVRDCNKSVTDSAKRIKVEQEENGNEDLQVVIRVAVSANLEVEQHRTQMARVAVKLSQP
ncbi:hypothetical protein ACS0TY_004811 [Phlomoides rotata]